ncbi:ribosome biogenesis protein Nop53/GLTSCR2 [Phyllosticta citriasiana]|uniref:Ribosome biogenesis protein NOP53 n=1 Tax=Phyllosticta citriasiana TaxID=595635 RepID=A0ABR1KA12_9PEZI
MSTSTQPPAARNQPSRKGKKAWRRNVDVTEVTTGLDNLREEVIQGGVISEKPSDELFAVDTVGSAEVKKEIQKRHKPLKTDEILAQRSAVPAVDSRKRSSSKVTNGVIDPSSKKRKSGGVSHKELERLKSIAHGGDTTEKDVVQVDGTATHDPWAIQEQKQDPRFSFIPEKKPIRAPETLKHAPIALSASGKPFPAVQKPEAGKSYNPLFDDWNELLEREGQKAVDDEKKRLEEAEQERLRKERAAAIAAQSDPESGDESAWESEWEGIQSEAEGSELKKKRPDRKTPQQRKKAEKRKEAERKAKWEAQTKKKQQQQEQIKNIAKEVEEREKQKAEQMKLVNADEESSADEEEGLRRRRFGKAPIPEAPLEVVLPDELQDSLRLLKPEGNLVKDRFRNMIIRGKIESRRPMQHKKKKVEVTEKWSYKDWTPGK